MTCSMRVLAWLPGAGLECRVRLCLPEPGCLPARFGSARLGPAACHSWKLPLKGLKLLLPRQSFRLHLHSGSAAGARCGAQQ